MYPALVAGYGDIVRAANAQVAPSYGDVGATWLWTPVRHGRWIVDGRDLEEEEECMMAYAYIHTYTQVHEVVYTW